MVQTQGTRKVWITACHSLLFWFPPAQETTLKISNPSESCTELFKRQALRSDELKIELQRQMQLLEWLVAKWGFQEIARPRAELKKKLSKVDDLPLVEVEREVQSACEIFQCCSVALRSWLRDVKCRNQSEQRPCPGDLAAAVGVIIC